MELSSNLDALSAILQICLIDLLLSGDNAIVIAMACAALPADVRSRAVLLGTGAAVFFRVILTFVATLMLRAPYLKIIGAGLLLLIAIELLAGEGAAGRGSAQRGAAGGVWRAIAIIVVADAVMSLDNVVAVAAAAQDNLLYLLLGLLISVPILIFSSLFIARLLDTYPLIVDAGAALLGWIAGKIAVSDPAIAATLDTQSFGLVAAAPLLGALYVLIQGRRLRRERSAQAPDAPAGAGRPVPDAAPPARALQAEPVRQAPATPLRARAPAQVLSTVADPPATAPVAAAPVAPVSGAPVPGAPVPGASAEGVPAPAAPPPPAQTTIVAPASAGTPPAETPPPGNTPAPLAVPELDLPRRLSKMDLTILGGVAVPLLGLVAMILYFIVHAARSH